MFIGYPCLNWGLAQRPNKTFRLASYSEERVRATVAGNLEATARILEWNRDHGLGYFRISSELVPFASHPICRFDWAEAFADRLAAIGAFIRATGMRIAMHPDQFTLINSPDDKVFQSSRAELAWHARLLDAMGLDLTARIQIHVGGAYGNREASRSRFVDRFHLLPEAIRRRLSIENDDRLFTLADCLWISERTGVPVLLDVFHHALNGAGEPPEEALDAAAGTWTRETGRLLVDYSSQAPGKRPGTHAETLDRADFSRFLRDNAGHDLDVMLEIRDKEASALLALELAATDPRLRRPAAG